MLVIPPLSQREQILFRLPDSSVRRGCLGARNVGSSRSPWNASNSPGILLDYGKKDNVGVCGGGGRTVGSGPLLTNYAWQHLVISNFGEDNDRIDFDLNRAEAGPAPAPVQ